MSRLNAVRFGFTPYIDNHHIPECADLFDRFITANLESNLKGIKAHVTSHPHFNQEHTRISLNTSTQPRWLSFRFNFDENLIEDILSSPDAVDELINGGSNPLQILQTLQLRSHELDAWTRGHIHYVHSTIAACHQAHDALGEVFEFLDSKDHLSPDEFHLSMSGLPPHPSALKAGFDVRGEFGVIPGNYTCPSCGILIPDLPSNHSAEGIPFCRVCL